MKTAHDHTIHALQTADTPHALYTQSPALRLLHRRLKVFQPFIPASQLAAKQALINQAKMSRGHIFVLVPAVQLAARLDGR